MELTILQECKVQILTQTCGTAFIIERTKHPSGIAPFHKFALLQCCCWMYSCLSNFNLLIIVSNIIPSPPSPVQLPRAAALFKVWNGHRVRPGMAYQLQSLTSATPGCVKIFVGDPSMDVCENHILEVISSGQSCYFVFSCDYSNVINTGT